MWILWGEVLKLVQPCCLPPPCSTGTKKPRAGRVNRNGALCGGGNLSAGLRLAGLLVVEFPGAVVGHGIKKSLYLRRALPL